jgi:hypothetical protein
MAMCCSQKILLSKRLCLRSLALLLMVSGASACAARLHTAVAAEASVSAQLLMQTAKELSQFNGRQSGTPDGQRAADYIANRLGKPILQSFPIKTNRIRSVRSQIRIGDDILPLREGIDYLPIISGASGHINFAQVLFVGYGSREEYAGQSASGNVVLFLRGQPRNSTGRLSHAEKVRVAHAQGAVAYITVTGPLLSPYEQRRGMTQSPVALYDTDSKVLLPGVWMTPDAAQRLLQGTQVTLESFQKTSESGIISIPMQTNNAFMLELVQEEITGSTANVLAFLPGSDAALLNETIILGAHYDHFGSQGTLIFPGADDNASGTAIVLEVARLLFASQTPPRRGVLFIAFAGEEQGLLGSKFYVSNPIRPLNGTKAMINVDHASVGNGKLTVGLSQVERIQAEAAATSAGLSDKLELFGFFPGGDHVPFVEAGIPTAAIVSSGAHPDFHRPSDTPEKLMPEVLAAVAQYTLALLLTLANPPP